ncbi:MAG: hypothetical protein ACREA8_04775 [Nitrosotalea sp.]
MKNELQQFNSRNPYILFSKEAGKYYCQQCNTEFTARTSMSRHCIKAHHIDMFGNPKIQEDSSLEKQTVDAKQENLSTEENDYYIVKETDTPEIKQLKQKLIEKTSGQSIKQNVDVVALQIETESNKELASMASRIVQNIDIMFLYKRTKSLFPPSWTFEEWLIRCITFTMSSFGVKVSVHQDVDSLSPQQLEYVIQVKKEHDAMANQG